MAADRGLTGRDVIAKTFSNKSRKGYEPTEVDTYLEQVAAQIDSLHAEIGRLSAELDACVGERNKLASAPPPAPVAAPLPAPEPIVAAAAAPDVVAAAAPAPVAEAVEGPAQQAANEEAAEVILRMAQRASADAIGEARTRANEIIAEAEVRSTEIARESDRKAFEAASRLQGDLRALEGDVDNRKLELERVEGAIVVEQHRLRQMADDLMGLANTYTPPMPAPVAEDNVIDLTASESASDSTIG